MIFSSPCSWMFCSWPNLGFTQVNFSPSLNSFPLTVFSPAHRDFQGRLEAKPQFSKINLNFSDHLLLLSPASRLNYLTWLAPLWLSVLWFISHPNTISLLFPNLQISQLLFFKIMTVFIFLVILIYISAARGTPLWRTTRVVRIEIKYSVLK